MSSQLLEVSSYVSSDAAAADLVPEERAFSIPSGDLVPSKVGASLVPTEDLISFAEVSDLVIKLVHIYIPMIILRNH